MRAQVIMQAAMVDWCLTANKVRGCRSVDLFIYSWTSMNLFWQFTVKKISSPWKQYTQLSITDIKMLQLTGKIWKAHKVCNFFLLLDWQNFHHFFKLGAWNEAKTCACMLITFFPSEITSNYLKLYQSVHYWASN